MSEDELKSDAGIEDAGADAPAADDTRDWFLQEIVRLGSLGLRMGITLTTGGSVISGTLISGVEYFKRMSAFIEAGGRSDSDAGRKIAATIAEDWKSFASVYDRPEDAPDDWQPNPAGFIHLDDAKVYIPGQPGMPKGGSIWRIRLNEVSGFSLGQYQEV